GQARMRRLLPDGPLAAADTGDFAVASGDEEVVKVEAEDAERGGDAVGRAGDPLARLAVLLDDVDRNAEPRRHLVPADLAVARDVSARIDDRRERVVIVAERVAGAAFRRPGPAELAHYDHQRVVEERLSR